MKVELGWAAKCLQVVDSVASFTCWDKLILVVKVATVQSRFL